MADEVHFKTGRQQRIAVILVIQLFIEQLILIFVVFFIVIIELFGLIEGAVMPVDLPADIQKEKNKLETKSAWLWLLDVTVTGVEEVIRLVNNTENISYGGNVYTRCSFKLGPWEFTASGELPRRQLSVTNIDVAQYLLPYVEQYDGAVGSTVVTTPVNSEHLDVDMSSKAMEFMILSASPWEDNIAFTLGGPNPLIQRLQDRYFANYCRFVKHFKGVECGYSGAETVCNGTLARCKELSNQTRFGGETGMRAKTVRFAR